MSVPGSLTNLKISSNSEYFCGTSHLKAGLQIRRPFGGVGFWRTLGVGVRFFYPTPEVQWIHFLHHTSKLGIPVEMVLLQPLRWHCVDCVIHRERDVRKEQQDVYVARTSNNRVISIVACYHSAKLCAHAARDFHSQQNSAVTRMWRSCGVQPSHKECAIGVVRCKKEGMLLQPLRWRCVDCVIHYEQDVRDEQQYICGANKQ